MIAALREIRNPADSVCNIAWDHPRIKANIPEQNCASLDVETRHTCSTHQGSSAGYNHASVLYAISMSTEGAICSLWMYPHSLTRWNGESITTSMG